MIDADLRQREVANRALETTHRARQDGINNHIHALGHEQWKTANHLVNNGPRIVRPVARLLRWMHKRYA